MDHGRTRARTGAGLLATGLVLIIAGLGITTAAASGEFTLVTLTSPTSGTSTTFTWSYTFNANGGHDLSNIAIRFCADVLGHVVSASPGGEVFTSGDVPGGHTGFGPGIKFGTSVVTGTLSVTFDQAYAFGPLGIAVQSHSGDGQTGDTITYGNGPLCPGDPSTTTTSSTTSTTVGSTTTTKPPTTTTTPPTTAPPTTTTVPATTTTTAPTATTTPTTLPPTTTTLPSTTTTAPTTTTTVAVSPTTALATTTTDPATTTTGVRTAVLDVSESRDPGSRAASLARTGSGSIVFLVGLGILFSAVGAALLIGEFAGRRADYGFRF